MNKYIMHFVTITKHIYYVRKFCFKCGFYKRGLLHDLSKYSPIEFFSSAKYFQGNRSPIDAEKQAKAEALDKAIDDLRMRFGKHIIRNACLLNNPKMPDFEHKITMPNGVPC